MIDQPEKIHIWEKDICWPTDRQNLYRNPSDDNFQSYAKPINWSRNLYDDTILNKKMRSVLVILMNILWFGCVQLHFQYFVNVLIVDH